MTLFNYGNFNLHSGDSSNFKIDCDYLSYEDLEDIASLISESMEPFHSVYGIPRGGEPLAEHLRQYIDRERGTHRLIVDDVLTTGSSMEEARSLCSMQTKGVVIFSRILPPDWISALFLYIGEPLLNE